MYNFPDQISASVYGKRKRGPAGWFAAEHAARAARQLSPWGNLGEELGVDYRGQQDRWSPEQYYEVLDGLELPSGQRISRDDLQLFFYSDIEELRYLFGPELDDILKSNNWAIPNGLFILNNNGKFYINFWVNSYEETEANIRALAIHEIWGHGIKKWNRRDTHYLAYQAVMDSKYWDSTTLAFKIHMAQRLSDTWGVYRQLMGTPGARMKKKYREIIEKYLE